MSIFATRFSYNSYLIKCVSGIMITITFHSNGYADFNTLTAKQIIPQKEKRTSISKFLTSVYLSKTNRSMYDRIQLSFNFYLKYALTGILLWSFYFSVNTTIASDQPILCNRRDENTTFYFSVSSRLLHWETKELINNSHKIDFFRKRFGHKSVHREAFVWTDTGICMEKDITTYLKITVDNYIELGYEASWRLLFCYGYILCLFPTISVVSNQRLYIMGNYQFCRMEFTPYIALEIHNLVT